MRFPSLFSKISPQKDLSSQAEDESEGLCYEEDISTAFTDIDRLFPPFTESMEEDRALFLFNQSDISPQRVLENDQAAAGASGPELPNPGNLNNPGLARLDSERLNLPGREGPLEPYAARHGDEFPSGENRFFKRARTDEALQRSFGDPFTSPMALQSQTAVFSLFSPPQAVLEAGQAAGASGPELLNSENLGNPENPRNPGLSWFCSERLDLPGGEGPSEIMAASIPLPSQNYSKMSAEELLQLGLSKTALSKSPKIRQRIKELAQNPNLTIEEAMTLLKLQPKMNTISLRQIIAKMSALNIRQIFSGIKYCNDADLFLRRPDITFHLDQLANDPNLESEDAVEILSIRSNVETIGIHNAIAKMSVEMICKAWKRVASYPVERALWQRQQIELRFNQLANDPDLKIEEAMKILAMKPETVGFGLSEAILQMSATHIEEIRNSAFLSSNHRSFHNLLLERPDVIARLNQLANQDLTANEAVEILRLRPQSMGVGIDKVIAQMSATNIYRLRFIEVPGSLHAIIMRPEFQLRISQLEKMPDLSVEDAKMLLELKPDASGAGISNAIAQMDVGDIKHIYSPENWWYSNQPSLKNPRILLRFNQLIEAPNLTISDIMDIFQINPQARGTGISDAMKKMSIKHFLNLLKSYPSAKNREDIQKKYKDVKERLKHSSITDLSIDQSTLKMMLKINSGVKGPAIANVFSQMSLRDLRDLPITARKNPIFQARLDEIKNSTDLTGFDTQCFLQIQPDAQGEKIFQGLQQMNFRQMAILPPEVNKNPIFQRHLDNLKTSKNLTAFETQSFLQIQPDAQSEKISQGIQRMNLGHMSFLPSAAQQRPDIQERIKYLRQLQANPYVIEANRFYQSRLQDTKSLADAGIKKEEAICCVSLSSFDEIDKPVLLKTGYVFHLFEYDSLIEAITSGPSLGTHPLTREPLTVNMLKQKGENRILWKAVSNDNDPV